jgi:hypothetical protein
MSAVELWKAQQPLLSQWSGPNSSKWRIVGNGENVASDSHLEPWMKVIFNGTQQNFRIFFNTYSQVLPRVFRRTLAADGTI